MLFIINITNYLINSLHIIFILLKKFILKNKLSLNN